MGYAMTVRCSSSERRDHLLQFVTERWSEQASACWPHVSVVSGDDLSLPKARSVSLGIWVSLPSAAAWELLAWLAVRSGWSNKSGHAALWIDEKISNVVLHDSPEAATTRGVVVNPRGLVVGNDPTLSQWEQALDPQGTQTRTRRALLETWADAWEQTPLPVERRRKTKP